MRGSTNRRIKIQTSPGIKQDPISKITSAKRAGGMAQVVEHLSSKHKAQTPLPQKFKNGVPLAR
jgi:hypothetical protein